MKPEYISDFLTNDIKPSALNYIVDELHSNDSILQQQDETASVTSSSGKRKARQSSPKKEKRTRR